MGLAFIEVLGYHNGFRMSRDRMTDGGKFRAKEAAENLNVLSF